MHIQRGFVGVGILIAIVLGIVILGGGAYYLGHQNAAPQTQQVAEQTNARTNAVGTAPAPTSQTQNITVNTSAPFATINKTSLTTNLRMAKITGTCGNVVGTVSIEVIRGDVSLPSTSWPTNVSTVWSDSTSPGQTLDAHCNQSNGTFSTKEIPTIQGTYTVGVYNVYKYATANTEAGIRLLASGTLSSNYQTSDMLPTNVGQCVTTTVKEIDSIPPPAGTTIGEDMRAGRSALQYTAIGLDGGNGYQVSDTYISGIDNSRAGDSVKLCLKSLPQGCPLGDDRGKVYTATNLRTNETWEAYDSRHMCGGA